MQEKILNKCGDVFITCLEMLQAFFFFNFGECMYVGFPRNMGDCMFFRVQFEDHNAKSYPIVLGVSLKSCFRGSPHYKAYRQYIGVCTGDLHLWNPNCSFQPSSLLIPQAE